MGLCHGCLVQWVNMSSNTSLFTKEFNVSKDLIENDQVSPKAYIQQKRTLLGTVRLTNHNSKLS